MAAPQLEQSVSLIAVRELTLNRGRDLSVTRGVEFSVFGSCVAFSRAGPVFSQGQFPLGALRGQTILTLFFQHLQK